MSLLAAIAAKPIIALIEKEFVVYEPELQAFLLKEGEALLAELFAWINKKKAEEPNAAA